jgi:hypothetical protein
MHRPIFWITWTLSDMLKLHPGLKSRTLLAYFSLMLSSIATALNFEKSSGEIWIRSEMVVCSQ